MPTRPEMPLKINIKPFFSIITPIYNGLQYIDGYIAALQEQIWQDWEAIIIDDGSTDGSYSYLKEATHGDPRFQVHQNKQPKSLPGPYQARNGGIQLARGEWVCFLDIDDLWLPHKLQEQASAIQKSIDLKLVYSNYWRSVRGHAWGYQRKSPPWLQHHQLMAFANPIPMLAACVRAELARKSRFEAIHHEDFVFWYLITKQIQAHEVEIIAQPLALYSVNPNSLSGNKLTSTVWIWKCYRSLGYSNIKSLIAIILRSLLQCWYMTNSLNKQSIPFDSADIEQRWLNGVSQARNHNHDC